MHGGGSEKQSLQCGNYRNLLSNFWQKFRESNVFMKQQQLLKSWFDKIFFSESKFLVFPHCVFNLQLSTFEFVHRRFNSTSQHINGMKSIYQTIEDLKFTNSVFPITQQYANWETDDVSIISIHSVLPTDFTNFPWKLPIQGIFREIDEFFSRLISRNFLLHLQFSVKMLSALCKFQNLSATKILREINFWRIQSLIKCLDNSRRSVF